MENGKRRTLTFYWTAFAPEAGLLLLDALAATGELASYSLLPAARADLLRRLGRDPEARKAYEGALALTDNESERRYYTERLRALAQD